MIARCYRPTSKAFYCYGARGISVCDRWRGPSGFSNFCADMGDRPDGRSLDRINNNGNYEPSNCRWATRKEQQRNLRTNVVLTIEGQDYLLAELAERSGLKADSIKERHAKGLTLAEILDPAKRVYTDGLALGGNASGAKKRAKTHCKNGHEFTDENTLITKEGWRSCRRCHADRQSILNKINANKG